MRYDNAFAARLWTEAKVEMFIVVSAVADAQRPHSRDHTTDDSTQPVEHSSVPLVYAYRIGSFAFLHSLQFSGEAC